MAQTTHTPGPWRLGKSAITTIAVCDSSGWNVIAHVPDTERTAANAALVATAPELLEALSALYAFASIAEDHIKIWSNDKNKNPELETGLRMAIDKSYKAIQKATLTLKPA